MITARGRVSCRSGALPSLGRLAPGRIRVLPGVRILCMIVEHHHQGRTKMSNKTRNRLGQSKLAANMKVRLDRGAAKLAAKSKRRAAKAGA